MKVKELIEKLKGMNQDLFVYVPRLDNDFPEYQRAEKAEDNEFVNMENDKSEIVCLIMQ